MRSSVRRTLILILAILVSNTVPASETLDSILARMAISDTRLFRYTETRQMALLNAEWKAEGRMFLAPARVVIDQRKPDRKITDITNTRLLYVDLNRNIRRTHILEDKSALPGIGSLMQIFQFGGNRDEFESTFDAELITTDRRWNLSLIPRKRLNNPIKTITLAGQEDQGPESLSLLFFDGDVTHWELTELAAGQPASEEMSALLDHIESVKKQ